MHMQLDMLLCGLICYWLCLIIWTNRFGTSERQWVEAQAHNAKQQAILMAVKAQVTSDEAHIHYDIHSLRYLLFFLLLS